MSRQISNSRSTSCETPVAPVVQAATGAGLTLRPVRPEDAESIHALLLAGLAGVLSDRSRWLARWRWQYWDNPYRQDRPAGWVLTEQGRIVGHLGAVYVPLRVDGQRVTGVIAADYVVAGDVLERGGVFAGLQLAQAFFSCASDDVVAMATTANEKTAAVFGRFGCVPVEWTRELWRAPCTLAQQIRTCRGGANRLVRRVLSGFVGSIVARLLAPCYRYLHHSPAVPIPSGCRLETTVPQLARDLGALWSAVAGAGEGEGLGGSDVKGRTNRGGFGMDRSQDYLDWRYAGHPERHNMRVLVVRDPEGCPVGAVVVFFDERDDRRVALVEELIAFDQRADILHTLMSAALQLACDHEADYLVSTTGRCTIRPRFWQWGFESRARSAPALVVRAEALAAGGNGDPSVEPPRRRAQMGDIEEPRAEEPRASARAASQTGTHPTPANHPIEEPIAFWHGEMF